MEVLNQIWELDRVFTSYLMPQQKLVFKERHGAKVTKHHDRAATPQQRAINYAGVRKRPIIQMNAQMKKIKPLALSRQIGALTQHLEVLSLTKRRAPVKPVTNDRFNTRVHHHDAEISQ